MSNNITCKRDWKLNNADWGGQYERGWHQRSKAPLAQSIRSYHLQVAFAYAIRPTKTTTWIEVDLSLCAGHIFSSKRCNATKKRGYHLSDCQI